MEFARIIVDSISFRDFPVPIFLTVQEPDNAIESFIVRAEIPVICKMTNTHEYLESKIGYSGDVDRINVLKTVRDCVARALLHELDEQLTVYDVNDNGDSITATNPFDPHDPAAFR